MEIEDLRKNKNSAETQFMLGFGAPYICRAFILQYLKNSRVLHATGGVRHLITHLVTVHSAVLNGMHGVKRIVAQNNTKAIAEYLYQSHAYDFQ